MKTTPRRFPIENELLAMAEDALFQDHQPRAGWLDDEDDDGDVMGGYTLAAGVAVVSICGPLLERARSGWFSSWDGYDSVLARVECALMDKAVSAVVLSFDSPGGMATGMVDGARAIRMAADRYGKPVVAHAGSMACSAAYGLAVAADHLMVTSDGTVGSVGILATIVDRTKQNEQEGLNVVVLRSGALKADGHPDIPLTAAATSRLNARVTQLAGMFAAWVGERRGMTADAVLALQGGVAYGADACTKSLADSVGTLADAVATAAALANKPKGNPTTMKTAAQALALLEALREQTGATSDEELTATVATLKKHGEQLATVTKQRDDALAQLAERDHQAHASARDVVLVKHRARGALTPAMEADAAFMGDLAPLKADALDRVLSRLAGLPTQAHTPPPIDPIDPKATGTAALSAADREWMKATGATEAGCPGRHRRRRAPRRRARLNPHSERPPEITP